MMPEQPRPTNTTKTILEWIISKNLKKHRSWAHAELAMQPRRNIFKTIHLLGCTVLFSLLPVRTFRRPITKSKFFSFLAYPDASCQPLVWDNRSIWRTNPRLSAENWRRCSRSKPMCRLLKKHHLLARFKGRYDTKDDVKMVKTIGAIQQTRTFRDTRVESCCIV